MMMINVNFLEKAANDVNPEMFSRPYATAPLTIVNLSNQFTRYNNF